MTTKLLPCPFCLSTDTHIREEEVSLHRRLSPYSIRVECRDCDALGPPAYSREACVEEWNKWAENSLSLPELLESLKKQVAENENPR